MEYTISTISLLLFPHKMTKILSKLPPPNELLTTLRKRSTLMAKINLSKNFLN